MADTGDYRNYRGTDFADIPPEILDRDTNPMFAYRDINDAERVG